MPDPVLRLRDLSYRYPGAAAIALRDVDLDLEPGELVVVAGRSGSGKSSLLRLACGLIPHFHGGEVHGEAEVCGHDLRDAGPAELGGLVGFVAQDPETQVISATVRAELELPLEIRGEPPAARARAVEEVALALGIERLLERSTATLSGGELQRVALAAALVPRPDLIALDEPTSQLDPVAGDELIGLLRRLNEEWGMAVLLAEHRLERCLPAADRVVAVDGGRIAFDGDPGDYLSWALADDRALATPLARLFDGAGIAPPPVSVKAARRRLGEAGAEIPSIAVPPAAGPSPGPQRTAVALRSRRLVVELDPGDGPREVVRGVSLELGRGERVALMGRNGAGKSTLLRVVAGLVQPSRGSLETPAGWALVPQSPGDMIVRDRVGDELPGPAGAAALERVGLAALADSDPRDLSGGERQRLALAIAMAGREDGDRNGDGVDGELPGAPGLVCLDEPTRGMDGARKSELATRLERLAAGGTAIVVATHDVEFAAAFAERVVLMGRGDVIADGPAAEILAGGWYFATEVARALGAPGAVTADAGVELLRAARATDPPARHASRVAP